MNEFVLDNQNQYIIPMPNTPPNDDLITEVLNQDPKYVDVRNNNEADFKVKHKLNSSFGFTPNRFHWFKFRYAIPCLILFTILGISAYSLQNAKNLSKSSSSQLPLVANKEINNNADSSTLIAKAPTPFLPMPGSNELSDNKDMDKKTTDTPNNNSISAAPKGQDSNNGALLQYKMNLDLSTTVKSEDGSEVTFTYDQSTTTINYSGKVIGSDACTLYESSIFGKEDKIFVLKYKLKRTGDICAQVIKEIPVKGSLIYKLDEFELVTYDKLFTIQKM